jgi:signal transduction histidine kinase
LTALVGAALSVTAFVSVQDQLRRSRREEFSRAVGAHAQAIRDGLIAKLEALRSIGAFYAATRQVERSGFAEFVRPILARHPEVYAFGWIARVPRAERTAFEEAARAEGMAQFHIVELMEGGSFTNAAERPEYFPVAFTEPDGPSRAVLGFDLASIPDRRAAMDRARDTGELASTDLVRLISESSEYGVIIFLPIYRNGMPRETVEQRREHLIGFAGAGLTIPDFVKAALANADLHGTAFIVEPPWSQPSERLLYRYPDDVWRPDMPHPDEPSLPPVVMETFNLAGRTWSIRCIPPAGWDASEREWQAWLVLVVGLLVTGLLTAYLMAILGRSDVIETLIAKRTSEWAEANRQLEQQMAQRLRLEQERVLQHETLQRTNKKLEEQQEAMQKVLDELQSSQAKLEAHNQEFARREQVMQSLLEDLNASKERIEQQAGTLHAANEKLKELAVLKDEFVAKVSHELRTPLTSVKEGISLMLDGALGETTADQQDFLQTMDGDIDRLTELINNMLDLSKIEAGRMRLFRNRVEVPKLVELVLKSYHSLLGKRAVHVDATPDLAPVFGDANRLTQVLTNLLSNAIKFTHNDGAITFRLQQRNGLVTVGVEDNGPGIAPDDLAKLFQKFSQVGQPSGGGHRGTGLGLVVCKELTELHGGRIEVASQVGKGTTFTMSLPAYTDQFALAESFREQLQLASSQDGPVAVSLVAVDVRPLLDAADSPAARADTLERTPAEVRQHLHRGDAVLPIEPAWVVALSATDARGARAIVTRLREKLGEGQRLQFGAAVYPLHGHDAPALFAHATAHMNQELSSAQSPETPDDTSVGTG